MEPKIDIFNGHGIEVQLKERGDFLKVKETLTRMGLASKTSRKLFQSCHILHKRGKYSILHFKELFALDGKNSDIDSSSINRRNTIARLLEDWGLLTILCIEPRNECPISQVKIIPFSHKKDWECIPKYSIGNTIKHTKI